MATKIPGGAATFTTPTGDVGIGHEYVAKLQREGRYQAVADLVWDLLEDFVEWYGHPYGDKFSGVDWDLVDVESATLKFLTEEVFTMPSFVAPAYGTAWAAFKGAVAEGDGFSGRMFPDWAKIGHALSLESVAEERGMGDRVADARRAVRRIALAYYEMLAYDEWIIDGGPDDYWLPSNFTREDGTKPVRLKAREYFDRSVAKDIVLKKDVLDRLDQILWSFVNRDLLYGFVVAKMRIVDTSQASPLEGTG